MQFQDYATNQKVHVLENKEEANAVASRCLKPMKIIGLDCEWNAANCSKISLIQVATISEVILFRLSKFVCWELPEALRHVLENEAIIKLGVDIQSDAKKLRSQLQCNLKGWLDLRSIAACRPVYGLMLVQKLKDFEEELSLLHDEHQKSEAANLEARNMKRMKRYNWKPKMGLGSLSEDCLGLRLQKNSSARWKDDWEADTLSESQVNYAAADSAVALDIFVALSSDQTLGKPVPFESLSSVKMSSLIDESCLRFVECGVKQKSMDKLCFALVAAADKDFDLTDYLTKHKGNHTQKPKRAKQYDLSKIKTPHRMISSKPLYENCKLFAPDGSLLCTCDKNKIEWYLGKGLAQPVEQPEGQPIAAKLLFDPSGRPRDSSDFYCQDKVNQCCCCGCTDQLVRKNVIPREYRKHFTERYKNRQSHDVVLLCVRCHCASNLFDNLLREELASEHGVPVNHKNSFSVVDEERVKVRSAASALTSPKCGLIPEKRKAELLSTVAEYLGHDPSENELSEIGNWGKNVVRTVSSGVTDHGTEVVRKVVEEGREEEFIVRWRNFFLSSMKPQHLPSGWSAGHRTRDMDTNDQKTLNMHSGDHDQLNVVTSDHEKQDRDCDDHSIPGMARAGHSSQDCGNPNL